MKQHVKGVGKEIGILKITQYPQIYHHTKADKKQSIGFDLRLKNLSANHKINNSTENENSDKKSASFIIKK